MALSRLDWNFTTYPMTYGEGAEGELSEVVLVKTTDPDPDDCLILAKWDGKEQRWLDVGRDNSWFTGGVVCWAYIEGVPETTKEMR
jgi:hypothetical protein